MGDDLLLEHLKGAWSHAVRAHNVCESANLYDTAKALDEIIVKLSKQLEFQLTMSAKE